MGRDIGSLSKIKTAQKAKMRGKPKVVGSEYLDLYMLNKEKERLGQYMATVVRTKESTEANLEEVEQEIEKLEKMVQREDGKRDKQRKSRERVKKIVPEKKWETMTLDY